MIIDITPLDIMHTHFLLKYLFEISIKQLLFLYFT